MSGNYVVYDESGQIAWTIQTTNPDMVKAAVRQNFTVSTNPGIEKAISKKPIRLPIKGDDEPVILDSTTSLIT